MYSYEDRMKAVGLYIKCGHSASRAGTNRYGPSSETPSRNAVGGATERSTLICAVAMPA